MVWQFSHDPGRVLGIPEESEISSKRGIFQVGRDLSQLTRSRLNILTLLVKKQ
jgi:hypothetical protein